MAATSIAVAFLLVAVAAWSAKRHARRTATAAPLLVQNAATDGGVPPPVAHSHAATSPCAAGDQGANGDVLGNREDLAVHSHALSRADFSTQTAAFAERFAAAAARAGAEPKTSFRGPSSPSTETTALLAPVLATPQPRCPQCGFDHEGYGSDCHFCAMCGARQ